MEKTFKLLYQDLIKNISISGNPHEKFLFKSRSHTIIAFCTASEENMTLEKVCEKLPHKIVSRSTIQSILKEGVANNFFIKEVDQKDKRQKVYNLTDMSRRLLENWLVKQKKFIETAKVA
tara:strand:- start:19 stop:378 length:360 start_codon:yes stop_codon:yes gene_type:complete